MRISGFGAEQQITGCATNCWRDEATQKCVCQPYGPGNENPLGSEPKKLGNAGLIVTGVIVGAVALALVVRGAMGAYVGKKAKIRYAGVAGAIGGTTGLAVASLLD